VSIGTFNVDRVPEGPGVRVWYYAKKSDEDLNTTLIFVSLITWSCQLSRLACSLPSVLLSSPVSVRASNQPRTDNPHPSSMGSSPNGWSQRGSFFVWSSLLKQKEPYLPVPPIRPSPRPPCHAGNARRRSRIYGDYVDLSFQISCIGRDSMDIFPNSCPLAPWKLESELDVI